MQTSVRIKQLIESDRWISFMESTAVALQLNIVIIDPDSEFKAQVPGTCSSCGMAFSDLTRLDIATALDISRAELREFITVSGQRAVAAELQNGSLLILRHCNCGLENCSPDLIQRAEIARKLMYRFHSALNEGFEGGRRAIELSTLRRMNHIVLSLFQGNEDALVRSIDLILSALVILLDARGSWLELEEKSSPKLYVKGDQEAVANFLRGNYYPSTVVELNNGGTRGRLGVLIPVDPEEASVLLPLMAQECAIVFEIDNLFKLLEKKLSQVLGAVASSVILLDRRGNITYANVSAQNLLDYTQVQLLGSHISSLPGPWRPYIHCNTSKPASGRMALLEGQKENGPRFVDWQLSPLLEDGDTVGWLVLADDRTDYYRWQEAARKAERMATTATTVGALAHEIRNPLTAARGMLQLMGRKREPEKIKGYTDLVLREMDRVTRLLNEFLLLGRPADISTEPTDLVAFVQELMPLLKGEAEDTGVDISIKADRIPSVAADQGQLTQVILNLTRNAVEAAGNTGCVNLTLDSSNNWVTLSVRDSGPGLPPEVLEKLFRPFFTTKERGTGLGLPVVQAIVHNHGGLITAANHPDGGAVFTVFFPIAKKDDTIDKMDVMLVVADEMVRYPSQQALLSSGLRVASNNSLSDALIQAHRLNPSVLILDEKAVNTGEFEDIYRVWPESKILIFGEPKSFYGKYPLQSVPRPLDYACLIDMVHKNLL